MKSNIVLIGPSGVGKTTVGSYISRKLDMELIDTDLLIEKKENKSIEEIFKHEGENYFRNLEESLIKKISKRENVIIATGGGIVVNPINIELLYRKGQLFLLYGSLETLVRNIEGSKTNRPLINKHNTIENGVKQLLRDRKDIYFKCSDYLINVDNKSIEKIGEEIINLL